ncbi:hypothetical protein CHS0354_031284 [Potamilus streckersoni]|uniref:C-type lectin domain-containing protein n=1 Tax=Potamilus streckersoni TaxID=2493646 RepID=A0AAE0WBZ1_9BIVA|nr:hypothetical protein CHS0354_031284 [Potamilus streckersoni]
MTVECGVGLIFMFLQMQLALISSSRMSGNNTSYIRATKQMSWLMARDFCTNASHSFITSVSDVHAFNSLSVGEFIWINAKEYSFCYLTKENNTFEECIYITIAQEDKRSNQTYICSKGDQFETTEDKQPFNDAVQRCLKTKRVLQLVNSFTLPLILPGNKTSWIDRFDRKSVIDSLSKLDTAETLTRKVKMLSTLEELNREISILRSAAENTQTNGDDGNTMLIPIVIGSSIGGVILLAVIIIIVTVAFRKYRKTQFRQVPACRV